MTDFQVGLVPTLPSFNPRYDASLNGATGQVSFLVSPTFSPRSRSPVPSDRPLSTANFETLVHPEGDVYYYDKQRKILTSQDPRGLNWDEVIKRASQQIARQLGGALPNECELYLKLRSPATLEVEYYIANHSLKTIGWADTVDIRAFGLPGFSSDLDLRSLFASEYWTHVEYFPNQQEVDVEAESELLAILRHGSIDDATSPGSTCPWSSMECRHFIQTLGGFQDLQSQQIAGYRVYSIARLWGALSRVRHINGHGTQNARLDRFQGLESHRESQVAPSPLLTILEAICFWLSLPLFERMTGLWNGRVVYQRHWKPFFQDMRREWTVTAVLSCAIWLAGILLLLFRPSNAFAVASVSLAAVAIFASLSLIRKHSENRLSTAPEISAWISGAEDFTHGLRPKSIAFALPSALAIYAFGILQFGLLRENLPSELTLGLQVLLVVLGLSALHHIRFNHFV